MGLQSRGHFPLVLENLSCTMAVWMPRLNHKLDVKFACVMAPSGQVLDTCELKKGTNIAVANVLHFDTDDLLPLSQCSP